MSEEKNAAPTRKILEKSPLSGIAVPIAIVLVSALIIFGVTKMLSSGKNHRDLVAELNSKTFGNRWVAAYELSKYLASSRIPAEDIPWVAENLIQVYDQTVDPRTRNFVVLALGTLKHPLSLNLLNKALKDEDPQVKFNAIVALGNLPQGSAIDWPQLEKMLNESDDEGLQQAIIATIASHRKENGGELLRPFLASSHRMLRYSSAMGLIYFSPKESIAILKEILSLPYESKNPTDLNGAQVESLKVNVMTHIQKADAKDLLFLVKEIGQEDSNIQVSTRAKELVNLLKY
ncbi:MAG: HEAT repeat domain-containing protein [Bacteriovoracaceae bacterium]|nr:HEAT repeat domain-containing protein [Bacteriovoracaceae bacterium]